MLKDQNQQSAFIKRELSSESQPQLMHNLKHIDNKKSPKILIVFMAILIAGLASGYFLSKKFNPASLSSSNIISTGIRQNKKIVGSQDATTFKDSAEGQLEKGGIDGEGTHKLVRPGGQSQNVYLTSSVLDLEQFVGKKVKVWGETHSAKKAGWLMDVGRVEVLD